MMACMPRGLPPLPFGKRAGVRGRACHDFHDLHEILLQRLSCHELASVQDCPLTPTLSPKGRGSQSVAGGDCL
jgi:hypothetical protein